MRYDAEDCRVKQAKTSYSIVHVLWIDFIGEAESYR